ncbi:MAG: hypothetical protein FWC91_12165, partial [Defluviitaleaceae bacterium]|nr:hypothetical protein [Defluviitaleaceae bacterium]
GLDMYEKVVNNLLEYRKYGDIDLKYVIIPGVNDNDEDINGMINLLELIKSNKMCLSYEYGMPVRSVFYALFHFVEKLKLNNKTFTFYPSYSAKQILSFIKEHSSTEYIFYLEQKNNFYKENFYKKYQSDYDSYRKFVYNTELTDLFKLFSQKTRFCLLNCDENKEIISVINELKLNVISITAPYEQAYEKFKSNVDVFITNNKGQFRGLQSFISSEGEVAKKFLDIETYMQSLEPKEVFVKNNVYHGLISSNGQ